MKIVGDEIRLRGEAHLPQMELIRKDAFPYQPIRVGFA
jgi:hypothetical protein